jgi:hypothetical protein
MSGAFSKALKSALQKASQSSKFKKIWTPTAVGADGTSAYTDDNLRVDRDATRRVVQVNSQTQIAAFKKYLKDNGSHAKVAVVNVAGQTGTNAEILAFIEKIIATVDKK